MTEPERATESRMWHVRYRQGEVGESQRSVHWAVLAPDGLFLSACGRRFEPGRMEEGTGGMPCVACIQRAALAAQGEAPTRTVDDHGFPTDRVLPE